MASRKNIVANIIVLGMMLVCFGAATPAFAVKLRDQIQQKILEKSGEQELTMPRDRRGGMQPQSPLDPEMVDIAGKIDARKFPAGSRVLSNQAYGPDLKQKLDVYAPSSPRSAPIIIMVHGGAWRVGDKANGPVVENKAIKWLSKGYVFVSVNYRLSPQANPIVQATDVMMAIAWVQKNAPMWGGDPNKIILMGHSAGAHLVALVSANQEIRVKAGLRGWRGSVILDSASFDIVELMRHQHYAFYDEIFGNNQELWKAASPYQQLKAGTSPMLLVCSTVRKDSCAQANKFAQKVISLGGQAVVQQEDLRHPEINSQLGLPGAYTDVVDKVIDVMLNTPIPPVITGDAPVQAPANQVQPQEVHPVAPPEKGIPEYQPVRPE